MKDSFKKKKKGKSVFNKIIKRYRASKEIKLFCCADPHGDKKILRTITRKVKKYKPDAVLCAGDLSEFGYGLNDVIDCFSKLKVPVFLIQGNHDSLRRVKKLIKKHKNIQLVHKKVVLFKNIYIAGLGGGGFSIKSPSFEKALKSLRRKNKLWDKKKLIFITHAPPYGTHLDDLWDTHVGNKNIRSFIENMQPAIAISGHLHENFHIHDKLKKTKLINPGDTGEFIKV